MAEVYEEVSVLKGKLEDNLFDKCSLITSLEDEGYIIPEETKTLINVSSVVVKAYEHVNKLSTTQVGRLNKITNKLLKL